MKEEILLLLWRASRHGVSAMPWPQTDRSDDDEDNNDDDGMDVVIVNYYW